MKPIRHVLPALMLVAVPAVAAEQEAVPTGITSVGPSVIIFTIAAALLATLFLRAMTGHFAHYATRFVGRMRIRRALRSRGKDVLHGAILPGAYGGLARIDHVLLTAGGIVCIRAVHVRGSVFGGEDDAQWTHVDGLCKRRFLNPLIQNEGRARAIRKVLPDVPVANLVVFTGSVEFSSELPANVIRLERLESFIAKYVFGPSRISDWDAVWLTLRSAVLSDADAQKDFAAQISFS